MEKYSFFNAVLTEQGTYDRVYKAEDIADYFSSFIGNGVYPNPSTNLQIASSNDGMKIYAKPGKAWINGYYYENTEDLTFRIDNADAQYDRIDDIVLRLDFLQRTITIQIKKGNPAISPAEQALQRDSDIHELRLAKVYVTKGAINITDVDITDTRQNSEDCGIVSGVVQQINTDDLFLQYNTAFDTWFEHVKDKLSEDAAGNLQAQIDEVKETYTIKNHASSSEQYGIGTGTLYGHVKLSDTAGSSDISSGIAATPKGVQDAIEDFAKDFSWHDTTCNVQNCNIQYSFIRAKYNLGAGLIYISIGILGAYSDRNMQVAGVQVPAGYTLADSSIEFAAFNKSGDNVVAQTGSAGFEARQTGNTIGFIITITDTGNWAKASVMLPLKKV